MAKNLILGPILARLPNFGSSKKFSWILPHGCYKLSFYTISRTTNDPNSRKWQKTSFRAWFRPVGPKLEPSGFFSQKIWLCQSLDIMVTYHNVQYQKKLMIQSWKNLVTTDRRTDGKTDENDFIVRCPTNVERPKESWKFC